MALPPTVIAYLTVSGLTFCGRERFEIVVDSYFTFPTSNITTVAFLCIQKKYDAILILKFIKQNNVPLHVFF